MDRKLKGVNPMALKVDIDVDLKSADPVHGFCTPPD